MTSASIKARISLTTISSRIGHVHRVISSILKQTEPHFRLRLYLSRDPYLQDEGVSDLPKSLDLLRHDARFEIHFVENIGSYRKLIPELSSAEPAGVPIVTADDDVLYPPRWLEFLLNAHRKRPDAVIAYRARLLLPGPDGRITPYAQWPLLGPVGSRTLSSDLGVVPTGKSGILYPEGALHGNICDKAFLEICPKADDLWFKLHSVAAGRMCLAIYHRQINPRIREIQELTNAGLYFTNMDPASTVNNDTQLRAGIEHLVRKGVLTPNPFATCHKPEPRVQAALVIDRNISRLMHLPSRLFKKFLKLRNS